ncbi:uncharacterized protein ACOB8E_009672 [Sarcophilus harrisii]
MNFGPAFQGSWFGRRALRILKFLRHGSYRSRKVLVFTDVRLRITGAHSQTQKLASKGPSPPGPAPARPSPLLGCLPAPSPALPVLENAQPGGYLAGSIEKIEAERAASSRGGLSLPAASSAHASPSRRRRLRARLACPAGRPQPQLALLRRAGRGGASPSPPASRGALRLRSLRAEIGGRGEGGGGAAGAAASRGRRRGAPRAQGVRGGHERLRPPPPASPEPVPDLRPAEQLEGGREPTAGEMSRRKQSNPRQIKRSLGDMEEGEDNQAEDASQSEREGGASDPEASGECDPGSPPCSEGDIQESPEGPKEPEEQEPDCGPGEASPWNGPGNQPSDLHSPPSPHLPAICPSAEGPAQQELGGTHGDAPRRLGLLQEKSSKHGRIRDPPSLFWPDSCGNPSL